MDSVRLGSLTYPSRCWHCKKWIWVVIPEQGGLFLADSLGKPWPKHDCPERAHLTPEEIRQYVEAPVRRIEKLWREAPQSMKDTGTTHVLLDNIRIGRRLYLGSHAYAQTSVSSIQQEEVTFYAPPGFARSLIGVSLAQITLKTYQRGSSKLVFLDSVSPFFEGSREVTGLAPEESRITLPMRIVGREH